MHVLIAPDKFKGTLTAREAAAAIANGWASARPGDELRVVPVSDGGDGFGAVLSRTANAESRVMQTMNAAHEPCASTWWWSDQTQCAILESANVIGLAMLPKGKYHPFRLDTFGLGQALEMVAEAGARRCILGIGGSATNDAGFGMARALGWAFLDAQHKELGNWTELDRLVAVTRPKATQLFEEFTVAVDVRNPLLGQDGASRVYGPQKGLRPADLAQAEACLARLAEVTEATLGRTWAQTSGSGAAGGLGFGLQAFAGAQLSPGVSLIFEAARMPIHLDWADLVLTGEGRVDSSSAMGKAVGELARLSAAQKRQCLAFCGDLAAPAHAEGLTAYALTQLTSVENALAEPERWLELLVSKVARMYPEPWCSEQRFGTGSP